MPTTLTSPNTASAPGRAADVPALARPLAAWPPARLRKRFCARNLAWKFSPTSSRCDLGNMFQFNRDFSDDFCRARSLGVSRTLNPALQTFDEWLARNKNRIPLA